MALVASATIAAPLLVVAVATRAAVALAEALAAMTVGVTVATTLVLSMLAAAEPAVTALVLPRIGGSATRRKHEAEANSRSYQNTLHRVLISQH